MEELLNKLIEKGWKPFGIAYYCSFDVKEEIKIILGPFGGGEYLLHRTLSLRELVSKESDLWQFVCENKLTIVKHPNENKYPRDKLEREEHRSWTREQGYYGESLKQNKWYNWDTAEYRLIESALKDESELEKFLLDNIKV